MEAKQSHVLTAKRAQNAPLSWRSSTLVDEPSALLCVVFLLFEERAPERAPNILRFSPAEALAFAWCSCDSTFLAPWKADCCCTCWACASFLVSWLDILMYRAYVNSVLEPEKKCYGEGRGMPVQLQFSYQHGVEVW